MDFQGCSLLVFTQPPLSSTPDIMLMLFKMDSASSVVTVGRYHHLFYTLIAAAFQYSLWSEGEITVRRAVKCYM